MSNDIKDSLNTAISNQMKSQISPFTHYHRRKEIIRDLSLSKVWEQDRFSHAWIKQSDKSGHKVVLYQRDISDSPELAAGFISYHDSTFPKKEWASTSPVWDDFTPSKAVLNEQVPSCDYPLNNSNVFEDLEELMSQSWFHRLDDNQDEGGD